MASAPAQLQPIGPPGDHAAFLKLFLRHESDLKAFIGSLILDRHARDDVFQDVALTLWEQFAAYDSRRPFGAWARGIAANKILQARHRSARGPAALAPEVIQAVLDAYQRTEEPASPYADALRECLAHLPEKARRLLSLRYTDDLPAAEIAQRTQSRVDAVYQALSRLRVRLEDCVRRRLGPQQGGAR